MTLIIQTVIRNIVPFILIFGAYVTVFGHLSPGGGFAGGSILATGLILERFLNSESKRPQIVTKAVCMKGVSFSLVGYGLIKGIAFFEGATHTHLVTWPKGTQGSLVSGGVIPVLNILIGIIVMFSFVLIFDLFNEPIVMENVEEKQ